MEIESRDMHDSQGVWSKEKFFSSKWMVGTAMFVLGAGLALSVMTASAVRNQPQNAFQTKTAAAGRFFQNIPLPSLPAGCDYDDTGEEISVDCSGVVSSGTMPKNFDFTAPVIPTIAVRLPNLPDQCRYQTTNGGMSVDCPTPSGFPQISIPAIPTVMVAIPPMPMGCQKETSADGTIKVSCASSSTSTGQYPPEEDESNQLETVLPSLPVGCSYDQAVNGSTAVRCESATGNSRMLPAGEPVRSMPGMDIPRRDLPENCIYENSPQSGKIVRCSKSADEEEFYQDSGQAELTPGPSQNYSKEEGNSEGDGFSGLFGKLFQPFSEFFVSLFGNK